VELHVLGDDNAWTVDPKYHHLFNELTLPQLMAQIGLTYTTELKADAVVPFRRVYEINYLKRSFRYEELLGAHVAPLALETVTEIPLWTKTGNPHDTFKSNLETYFKELSLHDKDTWNKYSKAMYHMLRHCDTDDISDANIYQTRTFYLRTVTDTLGQL
jgi:hypothetical protein